MATKQQAIAALAKMGLELDADSGPMPLGGFSVTIDAIGRNRVDGECRGSVVFDYTAKASAFWDEVIAEARTISVSPCPKPLGECDFHDG